MADKQTKILAVMLPVTCYSIYSLQQMMTGSQGVGIIKDFITGLF